MVLFTTQSTARLTHWGKFLCPTRHKIGHFEDVLASQSFGLVMKKLNLTCQKQTTQEKLTKNTKIKPEFKEKPKLTVNLSKNCSYVHAYHGAQLPYTMQHRTVLIIFALILRSIIIAQMLSTGGEEKRIARNAHVKTQKPGQTTRLIHWPMSRPNQNCWPGDPVRTMMQAFNFTF